MSFLVFGHRGSPARFPENTVASFEEALRAGADGFETDLRLLADGTPILFHDDKLGGREVESLDAAAFDEITRVRDLAPFAGRAKMILEVKRGGWEDVLVSEIAGWPDIVVASFDHALIASLAQRGVPFPLGLTFQGAIADVASYAASLGATWAFPAFLYVDRDTVASLHDRGIRVVPWTPNRERDWQRLREAGCDGIITDFPEEAARWKVHTF